MKGQLKAHMTASGNNKRYKGCGPREHKCNDLVGESDMFLILNQTIWLRMHYTYVASDPLGVCYRL